MEFEADSAKAAQNLKKHKISVEEAASEAASIFADPDHSIGETRWLAFGMSRMERILAVIYTERRGKIRTISARIATRHERRIYEEN